MSGVTPVSTVGVKKRRPLARVPPLATAAPFDTASRMWLSTFSMAASSITGPTATPSSNPEPSFSFWTAATRRFENSS